MNLRLNYHYIYIAIIASFFFFWGLNLETIKIASIFFSPGDPYFEFLSKIKLSYLIIFLIIPIFHNSIKERAPLFKKIFNHQQYIILFTIFVVAHFFLVKIYYHETIDKSEIANLFYLFLLSVIYCHYREFILVNFKKILTLYLVIFVLFSVIEGSQEFLTGQCNNDILIIEIIQRYLKISLTNSIYLENSHLAMMTIAVFFSSLYILVKEKKKNVLFLSIFSIEVLIVLNNLSTTYFVGYLFSQIVLLLFFLNKINYKFWIISVLFLFINSYLFLSDKNCTTKITDFKIKEVLEENLEKRGTNLTTLVYKRSIILALHTLKDHSLGWGMDGMDDATNNLMSKYNVEQCLESSVIVCTDEKYEKWVLDKKTDWRLVSLNVKDGLSNLFKLFTEFGIFAFIIYFYFIKYILNIKNINSYNLFIIVLFITMSIRGAGYFNGGFIFCVLEFFYHQKLYKKLKF